MGYENLIKIVGYKNFIEGRRYPYYYVDHVDTKRLKEFFEHTYRIKDRNSSKYYEIKISNNGYTLFGFKCTCNKFKKEHACPHIATILYYEESDITSYEIIDEVKVSKDILDIYNNSKKKNVIKEQLELDVEFTLDNYIEIKLSIGNKKKYKLSNNSKIRDFMNAYINQETYVFGKALTYDGEKHYFNEQDTTILDFIYECIDNRNSYYSSGYMILNDREFSNLLNILENKTFMIKDYGIIYNIYKGLPTEYLLTKDNDNYKLEINDLDNYKFIDNNKYVLYNHNLYYLSHEERRYLNLLAQNRINSLTFTKDNLNIFSNGLFKKVKNNIVIDEKITEIELPTKPHVKLYFDIYYLKLKCSLVFSYKDKDINYFDKTSILRDDDYENEVVNKLLNYGFYIDNKNIIMDDEDNIYYFIDEVLPNLSEEYEVFTSKKIDNTKIVKKVNFNNNFSIGQDGIMSYNFQTDDIDISNLNDIFSALKQKKKYYRLKNNQVIALENNEELEQLNNLVNDLELSKDAINSGNAEIPKYRALYIDSLKNNKYKNIKTNNLFDEFINNFKKYKDTNITFDDFDSKTLRDYQKEGVKWLYTIYKCDLGCILADEMGLGKSLQTIAFIKQILKDKPDSKIMIVVPTSLIYNWQKEFEKFAPNLKYIVVADNKQKRLEIFKNKDNYNIFITSYGLIRNDKDEYEDMNFELCVIDEAQNIKNHQAEMSKEIKKIKAKCKIALTGTPLENNITELWSIFDFIMPGYLNSIIKFKEKYNIKDVTEENMEVLKNLNYQIKPFILRRKKIDVVKSLPEKIENKIYIDLPDIQKKLYLKVLNDTKKEMDEMISQGGFNKSRMKILQLLTKLRQICIDPNVMYDNYKGESIKIEELLRIVKEAIENNHKILIFSSFKRVLDNVKKVFKENSISCYMIDGSVKSKDRMNMVEAFNKDNTNCFLITLKSGGTGLNLTGADTVIHLDIWWNPQVENQATDRAHRIGQTKTVTVMKLVTKGTIEERIIELQDKKKILSDNLIEGKTSSESLSSLTEKDIRNLLAQTE